jgi:hypothetical protein
VRRRAKARRVKHAAPHQTRRRVSVVKVAAIPALTATGLGLLAMPALALLASPHHRADATARDVADQASSCQAWEPVVPGLLYLGTAPVLTIGGVPLIGRGTCLPGSGKGYDIAVGADVALPPQSVCDADTPLPLLRLNLGLAIGVPDQNGYDPCQTQVGAATPAQATAPRLNLPRPPHVIPPQLVPPHVIPPQLVPPHVVPPQLVPPHVIPPQLVPPHVVPPHVIPPLPPRPPQSVPQPSSVLGSPPPNPAPPPTRRPAPPPTTPPPATPPPPPATTPAAVVPPPPKSPPPPRRPQPAPPVTVPAAAPPVTTVATKKAHPKPRPHAKPAPALPPPPFKQAAPAQQPAVTYKPGQPVMPVGVLITVVLTPCVATVAARLGKLMAGH